MGVLGLVGRRTGFGHNRSVAYQEPTSATNPLRSFRSTLFQRTGRMKGRKTMKYSYIAIGLVCSLPYHSAYADEPAPSQIASPEVYKVIAEDDKFLVIEATWKPGQKDRWHSHPTTNIQYHVTDCTMRLYTPDGKSRDAIPKAGTSRIASRVESHYAENVGNTECKIVFVEPKH